MARSTLHTPFAQQHSSSGSGSRVSPFQQAAAAALQSLESDDLESGWSSGHYGPGLRQRYLDVFEPLSSSRSSSGGGGGVRDRGGQDQQRIGRAAAVAPGPTHLRIILTEDALHSSSTQPHIIRARAILTTSSSARASLTPSPAHLTGSVNPRLRGTASLDAPGSGSRSHSSSSGGGSNTSLRRLQRRSSSLLAATSATASNLWSSLSAFGDRSRALLCRNSPVLHHGAEPGGPSSSGGGGGGRDPGRRGSVSSDGGARSSGSGEGVSRSGSGIVSLGAVVEAGPGAVVGSGRAPRLSQRLLLRSTAIRRSAGARSPAVLIDIDATDSYDDLLALDQFNVKRAVKASVLKTLPTRTPNQQDVQQQRQCHICFEAWVPPQQDDADSSDAVQRPARGPTAAGGAADGGQCCCQCGSERQAVPDIVQLLCWDGPGGRHEVLVPAPGSARLPRDDGGGGDAIRTPPPRGSSSGSSSRDAWSSPFSSSGDGGGGSTGGSHRQPVVRGWAPLAAVQGGASTGQGVSTRQVGPARVEAAAAAGGGDYSRQRQPVWPAAVHPRWPSQGHSSEGSSRSGGSSALVHGGCSCSCSRGRQRGAAEQHPQASSGVQIQQLPCGHEFCAGCIQPWLREHISCPVCRWTFAEGDTRLINK